MTFDDINLRLDPEYDIVTSIILGYSTWGNVINSDSNIEALIENKPETQFLSSIDLSNIETDSGIDYVFINKAISNELYFSFTSSNPNLQLLSSQNYYEHNRLGLYFAFNRCKTAYLITKSNDISINEFNRFGDNVFIFNFGYKINIDISLEFTYTWMDSFISSVHDLELTNPEHIDGDKLERKSKLKDYLYVDYNFIK